ncbi:MAG: cyclic nucleotide-binding domain-containing protein [Chloroflexi bacterium]|nr:cyclic nucleotide-binding domain-containing protein [Chloroflexota bacterium]
METSKPEVRQALAKCQVFSALNDVELRKVANLTTEKEYEAGATIFREGEPAEELLVLQEGKIALQMSLSAPAAQTTRRITVDIVSHNEIVGWSTLVEPHIFTLTCVCLQPVKVLSVNGIKLRSLLGANHHIGYQVLNELIKVVASRLDDTRRVLVSERLLPLKLD